MKYNEAVDLICPFSTLKRIASAHVVDYHNLKEIELRQALKAVRPQYLHKETVQENLEKVYFVSKAISTRVLSKLIIGDILIEEVGFGLQTDELEDRVIAAEQQIIDKSNEVELHDISSSRKSPQLANLELYNFVLGVAWEHRNTKSPDEANLLRKLRHRLGITQSQHRILEAKLGKYPKPNNELHTKSDIRDVRRNLITLGLLFTIRDDRGMQYDIIPDELAEVLREILKKEMRKDGYRIMLDYKRLLKKALLQKILRNGKFEYGQSDTVPELQEKIVERISPREIFKFINNDELHDWCSDLDLTVSGTKDTRIERLIEYYDTKHIRIIDETEDERKVWFDVFEVLAFRDRQQLRVEKIIDKDIEIEIKFEKATEYLFEKFLNHKPLRQPGTNKPDGLVSFKDMYIMWDNKSKESPGEVSLKTHLKQFHLYMEAADKSVPIFLVIAPSFTVESETVAIRYAAENIGRNIVLITAGELKELAIEWRNEGNKNREEPFPLGLLSKPGRFNRKVLGKLF